MFYITFLDKETGEYKTRPTDYLTEENSKRIDAMIPFLYDLYEDAVNILQCEDMSVHYNTRFIKKKSGKLRRIDEPDYELKSYMKKVIWVFNKRFNVVFPNSAYAYVKKRTTRQLASKHLDNNFLIHTDISNFFHSCTLDFVTNSMMMVYPFSGMDISVLEAIVKACMLYIDGEYRLPQGAPTSPMLSNIAMIPVDYLLQTRIEKIARRGYDERSIYTRYSDDMYVSVPSVKSKFTQETVLNIIENILKHYNDQFELNVKKTRVADLNDGTWILGMRLENKQIKIGSKKKQEMKAMIFSFLMDFKNEKYWELGRFYSFQGKLGHFKYIEPEYVDSVIKKYEEKTGIIFKDVISHYIHS